MGTTEMFVVFEEVRGCKLTFRALFLQQRRLSARVVTNASIAGTAIGSTKSVRLLMMYSVNRSFFSAVRSPLVFLRMAALTLRG